MRKLLAAALLILVSVSVSWAADIVVHGPALHPAAGGGGDVQFETLSFNNVNDGNLVVDLPSGTVAGNILVVFCADEDNAGTYTWPSGFTAVTGTPVTSTADAMKMGVAIKVATGSEPANYTIVDSTSGSICIMVRVSGGNTTGVPHRSSVGNSNASNASPWSMTTASFSGGNTSAKSVILLIAGSDVTSTADVVCTPPGGYTIPTNGDIRDGFRNLCFAYQNNVAAGATGALTMTGTAAGITSGWGAVAIALEVAP